MIFESDEWKQLLRKERDQVFWLLLDKLQVGKAMNEILTEADRAKPEEALSVLRNIEKKEGEMNKVVCTSCKGTKTQLTHVNYANKPCEWQDYPCTHCKGTGEIDAERLEWEKDGEAFKQWKLKQDLTLKELSLKTGFGVLQLSMFMQGRQPMPEAIKELITKKVNDAT